MENYYWVPTQVMFYNYLHNDLTCGIAYRSEVISGNKQVFLINAILDQAHERNIPHPIVERNWVNLDFSF